MHCLLMHCLLMHWLSACVTTVLHFQVPIRPSGGAARACGKALPLKRTLLELAVKNSGTAWVTKTTSLSQVSGWP